MINLKSIFANILLYIILYIINDLVNLESIMDLTLVPYGTWINETRLLLLLFNFHVNMANMNA
jgi:hypothetical protein